MRLDMGPSEVRHLKMKPCLLLTDEALLLDARYRRRDEALAALVEGWAALLRAEASERRIEDVRASMVDTAKMLRSRGPST